ncbi:MAG: DEAD/DEAH box helicase [Candidatus Thermoplasmatota archaeon]|nr:DEAD/DEAH box helicase [Candidatus Thermoplasmatota archaeon]
MRFNELPIQENLLKRIKEQGFEEMTEIQNRCIPEILKRRDIVGQAETGSGKTLAFCLPLLEKMNGDALQILVITPTRELCVQVSQVFTEYGLPLGIRTTSIYGGVKIEPQIKALRKTHIVVGTPGRILDHINRMTIDLRHIQVLVFDETDKMFDMGFIDDVEKIIRKVPQKRQTLMFSATINQEIEQVIRSHQNDPLVIRTQAYVDTSKLEQVYYDIYQRENKFSILVHLLKENPSGLSIVFCATRKESDILSKNLKKQGINAAAIHGGMNQNSRLQSLNALKDQRVDVLVATDVASRGLDIKNVTHIYNYDVPKTSKEYVHRIGRTARAGMNGSAITLLTQRDHDHFRRVQRNDDLEIERKDIPSFKKIPFIRSFTQQKRKAPRNRSHYRQRSFKR